MQKKLKVCKSPLFLWGHPLNMYARRGEGVCQMCTKVALSYPLPCAFKAYGRGFHQMRTYISMLVLFPTFIYWMGGGEIRRLRQRFFLHCTITIRAINTFPCPGRGARSLDILKVPPFQHQKKIGGRP